MRTRSAQNSPFSTGLKILDALLKNRSSMGVSQIAKALDQPVSSTHDNLSTMVELGYLEQDEDTRRYRLSISFFDIIQNFASNFDIVGKVSPLLQQLALKQKQTIYLCTLWHEQSYVISVCGPVGGSTALGTSSRPHASSAGKIMVAQLPESEWEAYAPRDDDTSITPSTNLNKETFYKELRLAKETGFAWNREEGANDIYSVAAPLPYGKEPYQYAIAFVTFSKEMIVTGEKEMEAALERCVYNLSKEL